MPDLPAPVLPSARRSTRRNPRSVWLVLACLVLAVIALAAIDGGERALRPISEDVSLPAANAGAPQ